ncbi:hypothetical protein [Streptomyces sp. R41]|uniref:Regulatory protein n=1 Tax=Streptomyces sp. R41 TaxID=3238632 RepID=A0AB39RB74_9ACTN
MSESQAPTTELTSQYMAQVTGDLERNAKEQERIGAEIEALQEQLRALHHDHTVLVNIQQALGNGSTQPAGGPAEADTVAMPSVPQQASAEPKTSKPRKTGAAATAKKTGSKKSAAKALAPKTARAPARPTLVDLIRSHLEQQSEPRSAAEISSALAEAHPDRGVKTTVVRTTLEGLVAKSRAQRTRQGSSVFYSAAADSEPVQAVPQAKDVTS